MKHCVCNKMEEMASVCTQSEDNGKVRRLICAVCRTWWERAVRERMAGPDSLPASEFTQRSAP